MGLGDILRKYFPKSIVDSIVKIEKVKIGGEDRTTIINIKELNIENFQSIVYDPRLKEKLPTFIEKEDIGLTRIDIALHQIGYVVPIESHQKLLETLKPYTHDLDHRAMIAALRIIELEDKNIDARREKLLFEETFLARGKKIYNLLRSRINGGITIFEGYILPFLELAKTVYKDADKIRGVFIKFFEETLEYYPFGIWVDKQSSKHEILRKIRQRIPNAPISIYARGRPAIWTAEKACNEYIKEHKEYSVERIDYVLGKAFATRFIINKKKSVSA